MKKWLFAVLFGSALVLGACGGDDAGDAGDSGNAGETTETAAGQQAYEANCAACHGADLSGGAGADLTNVGSKYSADEIKDIIHNGIGNMQAQNVDDETAQEIANYLAEQK